MTNPEQRRPLVLVVDAEQAVLDQMSTALAAAGLGCYCSTTPEAAEAAARTALPDLIVCDLNLGGESGEETCRRIKTTPGLEGVPVMFLSSAQQPDVVSHSRAAGGGYCFRKPFSPAVLVKLIDQTLAAPAQRHGPCFVAFGTAG